MSIDRQSVSNLRSSTMRKRKFRRVFDMFKLRTTLTKRERKKDKEISISKHDRKRKQKKRATKRRRKKIESKKVQRLKDYPSASDLTNSTMKKRRQRSRSDMPQARHSLFVSIQKIKVKK